MKRYPWAEVFGKEFPQIGEVANWAMPDLRNIALPLLPPEVQVQGVTTKKKSPNILLVVKDGAAVSNRGTSW